MAQSAQLFSGPTSFPWSTFVAILYKIVEYRFDVFSFESPSAGQALKNIRFVLSDEQEWQGLFCCLLSFASDFKTTEPRDKIFAVAGFFADRMEVTAMLIDYGMPTADLFLTHAYLELSSGRLVYLSATSYAADDSGAQFSLLSWASDWSRPTETAPYQVRGVIFGAGGTTSPQLDNPETCPAC
jgi:hypothetical protein